VDVILTLTCFFRLLFCWGAAADAHATAAAALVAAATVITARDRTELRQAVPVPEARQHYLAL